MAPPQSSTAPAPGGWPLERRLTLLISALLAGVVGAFGAAAYQQVKRAAVDRAADRLTSVAVQLATSSAAGNAPRVAALRLLAADVAVTRVLASPADDSVAADALLAGRLAVARAPGDSTLDAWELWTADGERRFESGVPRAPADSLALARTRAAAARSGAVERSALYHTGDRVGVWTVAPVPDADQPGRVAGFLAERRHLAASPATARLIRQLTGEDVTVYLTSRAGGAAGGGAAGGGAAGGGDWAAVDGTPVAAPFPLAAADPAPGRERHAGEAPGQSVAVVRDAAGVRQFVAEARVPQTPWVVVLAESEAGVLRRPHEFLRALAGLGLVVLAAGAVGAWLLGRHVTGPLREVTGAADALAGGDYGRRVAVSGGAELSRLAAAFNTMAARVGAAHRDLADRNADLVRANAAKAQFLAMMSHELRTPLNAIGGYTELIELGIRGPVTPDQVEDLGRIRRSKDHLLSIITDLLSFARADAGHLTFTLGNVPVGAVLADAEAALAHPFAAKGVRLAVGDAPPDAVARADREKLQQVVLNLLTNALRFTPAGGAVEVTCAAAPGAAPHDPGVVRVAVRDTGLGIPADKLDAIFEPFVQVDAALTRRVGGTGLGLAIVRNLVGAMGGEVAVESAVGAGSTFTVTLPRAAGAPAAAPGGAGALAGAAASPGA